MLRPQCRGSTAIAVGRSLWHARPTGPQRILGSRRRDPDPPPVTDSRTSRRLHDLRARLDSDASLLLRFVLLSMLLHALVLLVFGTAPGIRGAQRGEGGWEGLDVTLRRLSPEAGAGVRLAPGEETTSPGTALLRRLGVVPSKRAAPASPPPRLPPAQAPAEATTAPPAEPITPSPKPTAPATEAGPAAATPVPETRTAPISPPIEAPLRPTEPPESRGGAGEKAPAEATSTPQTLTPAQPSSFEALPSLNRSAPEEFDRPIAPGAAPPAPKVERSARPAVEATPTEVPVPAAPAPPARKGTTLSPATAPVPAPAPIERASPPKVEAAPAVEVPPREVPIEPSPQPVSPNATPVAPVAPVAPAAPPKVERESAPAIDAPREKPAPPAATPPVESATPPVERAAPLERATPPKIEREMAPAIEAPREKPAPIPTPAEPAAPAKVEPQVAPPIDAPVQRRAPLDTGVPSERPAPSLERAAPPAAAAPGKATAPPAPARTDAPAEQAPRLRFGAPDAGEEVFRPRNDIAAPPAAGSEPPRLDINATRQRAREIGGSAYRGVAPVIPPPPPVERKSKLASDIERAAKPDCRDAYAGLGLLAVVPLTVATIGNGGCRW